MRDIEKEIRETEAHLKQLRYVLSQLQEPMHELATRLHELLCRADHASGACKWDCENSDFSLTGPTPVNLGQRNDVHARYLRLAKRLVQEIGLDLSLRAVKVIVAGR